MAEEKEKNLNRNEFYYIWRIENVSLWWKKTGEKLKSPTFKVDWLPIYSFNLCLYPKGTEGNEGYLSYFLANDSELSLTNKEFKTELFLSAVDGSDVEPENSEGFWSMKKHGMIGCPRFMDWQTLMDRKSEYLPNDILTLCCNILKEVKPDAKGNKINEFLARTQIKKEVIAKQTVIDNIVLVRGNSVGKKSIMDVFPLVTFSAFFDEILGHRILTIDIRVGKKKEIKEAIFKLMLIDEKRRRIFWKNEYLWDDVSKLITIELASHYHPSSKQYVPHEMFLEKFLFLVCEATFTTGLIVQKQEEDYYGTNLNDLFPRYFPSCDIPTVQCPTLADTLLSMYKDDSSHDVTIKNDGSSVTAHKIVLSSRSIKFKNLLQSAPATEPHVIHVEDDLETLKKMVNFLYTDNISDINWKIAQTLYSAAIKYDIGLLKHKCFDFINANFNETNVAEILLLAKKHNDIELLTSARNFVMKNSSAVYNSDEWIKFCKSHSNFAVKIMLPKFQWN